jgi:hypothetical protein
MMSGSKRGGFNVANLPFMAKFMLPAALSIALLAALAVGSIFALKSSGATISELNESRLPEAVRFGAIKAEIRAVNAELFRTLTGKAVDPTVDATSALGGVKERVEKLAAESADARTRLTDETQQKLLDEMTGRLNTYAEGLDFLGSVVRRISPASSASSSSSTPTTPVSPNCRTRSSRCRSPKPAPTPRPPTVRRA